MPSKKNYSLVPNNELDLRIPLHSDEAFQHGISFQAQVSLFLQLSEKCRKS